MTPTDPVLRQAELALMRAARAVAEAWLYDRSSLSVALRELSRFFPAAPGLSDPRPSEKDSRPVSGKSDPGAGSAATQSDVTESDDRVFAEITPRWVPPNRIVSVPRELLADRQPELGDRLFDQMREAYAERVAEAFPLIGRDGPCNCAMCRNGSDDR
jgi:hypothetical protein